MKEWYLIRWSRDKKYSISDNPEDAESPKDVIGALKFDEQNMVSSFLEGLELLSQSTDADLDELPCNIDAIVTACINLVLSKK